MGRFAGRLAALSPGRRFAAAIGFGAVGTVALPPADAWPALLVAFPAFVWLLDGVRTRAGAFAVGWGFGFGWFVVSLYWIAFALGVDIARYFWLVPFAVAGLPALLAAFVGAAAAAVHRLPLARTGWILALAAAWGAAEWLRGHVATGFPWNLVGYVWSDWPALAQPAAWFGVYGLGLLTVAAALLPAAAVGPDGHAHRGGAAAFAVMALALAGLGTAGAARLAAASDANVPDVTLRLVQPAIPQSEKWEDGRIADNFRLHLELSLAGGPAAQGSPTHVIWPETAVPFYLERYPQVREAIADVAPPGGLVITGAPRTTPEGEVPRRYWNSLQAVDRDAEVVAVYDKVHLVPFGEYVPFRSVLPFEAVASGADYSAGPGPRTLNLPGLPPVSPLICYEAIFPAAVTAEGDRPAWLLNLTNDAWYGETAGPHQHFAIARMRAVEEGLPLVRVATSGISGVVDAWGRVRVATALGERTAVDAALPVATPEPTVYARYGDAGFFLLLALFAGASVLWPRAAGKRGPSG